MKTATVRLTSTSAYSQSRHFTEDEVPPLPREGKGDYEKRTWRFRANALPDGRMFIPPQAFANSIRSAAKRLGIKIPGKRNQTYTASFEAGIMVVDPLILPNLASEVPGDTLFVPSNGVKGSGSRVMKTFPRVDSWSGDVKFYILDDVIVESVFMETLQHAGQLVGIGRFRPEKGGFFGRFMVDSLTWENG